MNMNMTKNILLIALSVFCLSCSDQSGSSNNDNSSPIIFTQDFESIDIPDNGSASYLGIDNYGQLTSGPVIVHATFTASLQIAYREFFWISDPGTEALGDCRIAFDVLPDIGYEGPYTQSAIISFHVRCRPRDPAQVLEPWQSGYTLAIMEVLGGMHPGKTCSVVKYTPDYAGNNQLDTRTHGLDLAKPWAVVIETVGNTLSFHVSHKDGTSWPLSFTVTDDDLFGCPYITTGRFGFGVESFFGALASMRIDNIVVTRL